MLRRAWPAVPGFPLRVRPRRQPWGTATYASLGVVVGV